MKVSRATFEKIIRTLCRQQQSRVNIDLPPPPGRVSNSQNSPVLGDNNFWFTMTLADPGPVHMFNYGKMPGLLPKRRDLVPGISQCHLRTGGCC